MSYLSWISDENLLGAVERMVNAVETARRKAEKDVSRNGLDPFSMFFNISLLSHHVGAWKTNEIARQAEKGLSNALGVFHQDIISHVLGWYDPKGDQDFDLINHEKRIVVEMKNKYNTLNAEGQKNCFNKLQNAVSNKNSAFYQYTAYCVHIVPKKKKIGVSPFIVKDNATDSHLSNERVKLIDGQSFYALATGVQTALYDLLNVLPKVLKDMKRPALKAADMQFVEQIFKSTYN